MNKKIKKELVFFNENADLLRNQYDPVAFGFEGVKGYSVIILVDSVNAHIHVQKDTYPTMFFEYSQNRNFYYVGGDGMASREMTKKEGKLFKCFIDKIYEKAKKDYEAWL